ncbi:vacuolar protein sorting vps16 [Anaeramoeba flamelloides]|uniref:Vacuolar protein sorting vps16 n=1 Tax=Anaeramoeba flamelloides TaxID=1746091 RepID=A0AAV7YDU5_9EUKA|nr:vacuolar protein sorting vps16 [Anaeramoeba flamelloides]
MEDFQQILFSVPYINSHTFDRDVAYFVHNLYEMEWTRFDIDLSNLICVGSRYGGALALTKDPQKEVNNASYWQDSIIRIFSNSGAPLGNIQPSQENSVLGFGWTDDERIVLLLSDGEIQQYTALGELILTSPADPTVKKEKIYDYKIWGSGVIVLTKKNSLFHIPQFENQNIERIEVPKQVQLVTALAVIEERFTYAYEPIIILATSDQKMYIFYDGECIVKDVGEVAEQIIISPSGKFIAYYTSKKKLNVITNNFEKSLVSITLNSNERPSQIEWCSNDSVLLYMKDMGELIMVGPVNDPLRFPYESIYILSEIDGIRIISNKKCQFLSKIQKSTMNIFRLTSSHASSNLYQANESYKEQNSNIHDTLINLESDLNEAIAECLDAVKYEFNLEIQKNLIESVNLGKNYSNTFNNEKFLQVCKNLRVLNALRKSEYGIPLTYKQLEELEIDLIIERLINRKLFFLANEICQYLGIVKERILLKWACEKLKSNEESKRKIESIRNKIGKNNSISYATIATFAWQTNQKKLALQLLQYENKPHLKISLLLEMDELHIALEQAIKSGDVSSIYLVLFYVLTENSDKEDKSNEGNLKLIELVKDKPIAILLLKKYCSLYNPELFISILQKLELNTEHALHLFNNGLQITDINERKQILKNSLQQLAKSKNKFIRNQIEYNNLLLDYQQEYEKKINDSFVALTVNETLKKLILHNEFSKANTFKNKFNISKEKFNYLSIKILQKNKKWDELETFAKKYKSPQTFSLLKHIFTENGMTDRARKYD